MNLTEGQKQIGKENFSDVVEMTRRDFLEDTANRPTQSWSTLPPARAAASQMAADRAWLRAP